MGRRSGVALAIVALAAAACTSGEGASPPRSDPADPVPVAQLERRWGPAMAWTGEELFVWGGSVAGRYHPLLDSGATVAPDLSSMVPLPAAPFTATLENPLALGLDRAVLVAGVTCAPPHGDELPPCHPGRIEAALFHLDDRTWERLDLPPELEALDDSPDLGDADAAAVTRGVGVRALGVAPDGRGLIRVHGADRPLWAFDPGDRSWRPLPDPPLASSSAEATWSGRSPIDVACVADGRLVVAERLDGHSADGVEASGSVVAGSGGADLRAHVLDLGAGSGWRTLDDALGLPLDLTDAGLTCAGDHAVAIAYPGPVPSSDPTAGPVAGWVLDLETGRWDELPVPADPAATPLSLGGRVWTGDELLFLPWSAGAATAYDPIAGTARVAGDAPASAVDAVWGDGRVYAVPESGSGAVDDGELFAFEPIPRPGEG